VLPVPREVIPRLGDTGIASNLNGKVYNWQPNSTALLALSSGSVNF